MKSKIQLDDKNPKLHIPEEFDLEKYVACNNWGLVEWLHAISYRVFIQKDWRRSLARFFDTEDISSVYKNYKSLARGLLDSPLDCRNFYRAPAPAELIADQSVADLFEDADVLRLHPNLWSEQYREWSETPAIVLYDLDPKPKLVERVEKTPSWVMKEDVFGQKGIATISVDLNGDDRKIQREFAKWLKRTKKEMKIRRVTPKFDDILFKKWCAMRVLPCFDLIFFSNVFNGGFNNTDLLEKLFPIDQEPIDGNFEEDRIRRTIIPNALQVVSAATVNALAYQLECKNL